MWVKVRNKIQMRPGSIQHLLQCLKIQEADDTG